MPIRKRLWALAWCLALAAMGPACAWAQLTADDPDWSEAEVPAPPAFDLQRGLPFDVSLYSSLQFSLDPQTLHIGKDGVTSYVVMASSKSGALNAMYEGIRCATGEFKTYARYNPGTGWSLVQAPQWQSLFNSAYARHALQLARQGVCSGAAPIYTVREIVSRLKGQKLPY